MSFASIKGKPGFSDSDAETVAKSFKAAFKGFGTDEKRVIKELLGLTNAQRQIVKDKYNNLYGKTLEEDLKDELKGNFEDICIALILPRLEFEARAIRESMRGAGTYDAIVIDLLCTKESAEIAQLKEQYKNLFDRDFEDDIKGEAEGPLERVYRSIAAGNRPSGSDVDTALAEAEAKELYDAGEGQFGTDDSVFVRILVSRSFAQLKATFDAYQRMFNKDIIDSIKAEAKGNFEDALLAIAESVRSRSVYFAKRLRQTMEGPGTKDKELITILVSRSEIDLVKIRQQYQKVYNRSLHDDLKEELHGDYEDIVLKLVGKD